MRGGERDDDRALGLCFDLLRVRERLREWERLAASRAKLAGAGDLEALRERSMLPDDERLLRLRGDELLLELRLLLLRRLLPFAVGRKSFNLLFFIRSQNWIDQP